MQAGESLFQAGEDHRTGSVTAVVKGAHLVAGDVQAQHCLSGNDLRSGQEGIANSSLSPRSWSHSGQAYSWLKLSTCNGDGRET